MPNFIDRNYDSPLDLVRPLPPALALLRLGAFRRLDAAVGRFFDDERLQRLFSFQALYAGLAPHQALAVYAVITYMDAINGCRAAEGGVHALPIALADRRRARRGQVPLRHAGRARSSPNATMAVRSRGVRLRSAARSCRPTSWSATPTCPRRTARCCPARPRHGALRRGHYSPSAVVWHAGVRGDCRRGRAHHNIHFGAAVAGGVPGAARRGSADAATRRCWCRRRRSTSRRMAPAGPARAVRARAGAEPDGRHRLDDGAGSGPRRPPSARSPDSAIRPTSRSRRSSTPPTGARQGLAHGTPFGLSHRFLQTGPFRPSNLERRVPGLVFVGSSTVPGVGVPMVHRQRRAGRPASGGDGAPRESDARTLLRTVPTAGAGPRARPTTGRPRCCRGSGAATSGRCTRSPATPTTSSTTSTAALRGERAAALRAFGATVLRRPRRRRFRPPRARRGRRHRPFLAHRSRVLRALPAIDGDGPDGHRLRHVGRPAGLHGRLGGRDRRDDAARAASRRHPAALEPARDLGLAFQLTNFLRDVGEDLERGRVYLPREDLERFGAEPARRCVDDAVARPDALRDRPQP